MTKLESVPAVDQTTPAKSILCPKCGFSSDHPSECPKCGLIFSRYVDPAILKLKREKERMAELCQGKLDDRFHDGVGIQLLALPVGIVVTLLLVWINLPTFFLGWFAVFLHEVGHALIHWLSGRAAMPLAFGPSVGWASGDLHPSIFVGLCFLFLIGVVAFSGFRHQAKGLIGLAALLLVAQIYFSLLAPIEVFQAVMIFAGCAGEMVLGTLLVIGFYYRMPDRMRWDFFRFVFLVLGLYAYGRSALLWHKIDSGEARIPMGTFRSRDDGNGDMNRLLYDFGLDSDTLIGLYVTIAIICAVTILAHYAFFTWQALRKNKKEKASNAPSQ